MRKIIFFSVLLNLGLVGLVGYQVSNRNHEAADSGSPKQGATSPAERLKAYQVQTRSEFVTNTVVRQFGWEQVESEDYKLYIANLRQIECPEETIRDIIIADVNKYFAKQLAPLRKPREEIPFWRETGWGGNVESPEYHAKHNELEKEKRALLRELLGVDYLEEMQKQSGWHRDDPFMDSLPGPLKEQIREIQAKYGQLSSEVYRKARGHIYEEDQKELRQIEKRLHAELATILTPDQLFELRVRNSRAANDLKYNELRDFDANEQEFRAIVRAKWAAEEAGDDDDHSGPAKSATRTERQKAATEQLRAELGEERYQEYNRMQDWDYRNLVQLANRANLPRNTAIEIYSMKDEVQKAARLIQSNKDLTAEQRNEQLRLIRSETEKAITELLGEKGFKSYSRNAWWLRNISRN
ncbi:MAG: hypothetical protein ACK4UN_11905 [Limisphaerales bacterium]